MITAATSVAGRFIIVLCCTNSALAMDDDDPLLLMGKIDQFEWRGADGPDPVVFKGEGWIGHDLQRLWIKGDFERRDGETEEAEVQALFSSAISPYWNAQMGIREDFRPNPSRTWFAMGVQGLAPYFFEIDTAFFIGASGRTAFRMESEYDFLITQRLILAPEIEVNVYGKDDESTGTGSGLSTTEIGLRLRYEIRREFAPYIGLNWTRKFGDTADYARDEGEDVSINSVVIGVRAWY